MRISEIARANTKLLLIVCSRRSLYTTQHTNKLPITADTLINDSRPVSKNVKASGRAENVRFSLSTSDILTHINLKIREI